MIKHYLSPKSETSIDSGEVYRYLRLNQEYIPSTIFTEARSQIQEVLVKHSEPSIPFSVHNIEYVKNKYAIFMRKEPSLNIDFFLESNNSNMPLSIIEKMFEANKKHGKNFLELKEPTKNFKIEYTDKEVLDNEIHRWAYDIYDYYQLCELSVSELLEDFEVVIALYLLFLDPSYFTKEHLCKLYGTSDFKDVLKAFALLEMRQSEIVQLTNWEARLKFFEASPDLEIKSETKVTDEVFIPVKHGRKKTKVFEVRKPISRRKNDNMTLLSSKETAYFFRLLREAKILIQDDTILTQTDLSNHIACLVGYSDGAIMDDLSLEKRMDNKSLQKILKEIRNISTLTNSKLIKKY
jgi:hypothetical protein